MQHTKMKYVRLGQFHDNYFAVVEMMMNKVILIVQC